MCTWTAAISVAVVLVSMSACSSSQKSNSSPSSSTSTGSLEDQANQEGTVTWYNPYGSADETMLAAAFHKVYPHIKLNQVSLSADDLLTRVTTEQKAGLYNVDVVSANALEIDQLISGGNLAPYDAPTEQALPAGINLPVGYHGVSNLETSVIAYNPTTLKAHHLTAPTSLQDLTQPQWKGNFGLVDSEADVYQGEIVALGHDRALNLMKAIGNNNPRLVTSHSQAITEVESGDPPAAVFVYGDDSYKASKQDPSQLAFVNLNPLPTAVSLADLVKNAPHPAAGKILLNWFESRAGQSAIVSTGTLSLRDDANDNPAIWNLSRWKPSFAQAYITANQYNALLSEFDLAIKAP